MRHGFADTRYGQVRYVEHGSGDPVLLLHQTPRSWDEYRDVLPVLGARFRVIAMDTVGFGESARPPGSWSIELFAAGVLDLCDDLGLAHVAVVGHHTGAVIAVQIAASAPDRVRALVLSGMPFVDAERRRAVAAHPSIDHVQPAADGSHLMRLWNNRAGYYPADRPDLLNRLVRDALRVLDRVEEGHLAVNRYRMEERIGLVRAPTLAVCGELDSFSLPDLPKIVTAVRAAGGTVLSGTGACRRPPARAVRRLCGGVPRQPAVRGVRPWTSTPTASDSLRWSTGRRSSPGGSRPTSTRKSRPTEPVDEPFR